MNLKFSTNRFWKTTMKQGRSKIWLLLLLFSQPNLHYIPYIKLNLQKIEWLLRQTIKMTFKSSAYWELQDTIQYDTHHVCLQYRHLDCTKAPNSLWSPLCVYKKCKRPSFSKQRLSQSHCDQFPPIEGGGDATPPLTKAKDEENKWHCEEQNTICDVKWDWG